MARKGVVKAISYDSQTGQQSPVSIEYLDVPTTNFTVNHVKQWAQGDKKVLEKLKQSTKAMFDGNGYSSFYLPAEAKQEIEIDLGKIYDLKGFTYTPDQSRWGGGVITHYEFYAGNRLVASGEFSNIKNNPIKQTITFEPVKSRTVRLVAKNLINGQRAGIGEFTILTTDK